MFASQSTQLELNNDHDQDSESDIQRAFVLMENGIPLKRLYKKKQSFEEILVLSLRMSLYDPSKREQIGVFWFDENHIALKTKNLSSTIGLKPNSINCSLRQHHLVKVRLLKEEDKIEMKDKRDWKIMKDEKNEFERSKVESGQHHLLKWNKPMNKHQEECTTTFFNEQTISTFEQTFIDISELTREEDNELEYRNFFNQADEDVPFFSLLDEDLIL